MSAFEDFVQTELPQRPYLPSDAAQETLMVRRGAGPRQLDAVSLAEGQVLAKVGGQLVGLSLGGNGVGGVRSSIYNASSASATWNINHGKNSMFVIVQCLDSFGYVVLPDYIRIIDANNVEVGFNTTITGKAYLCFLD